MSNLIPLKKITNHANTAIFNMGQPIRKHAFKFHMYMYTVLVELEFQLLVWALKFYLCVCGVGDVKPSNGELLINTHQLN